MEFRPPTTGIISIHAPREGCDRGSSFSEVRGEISIHAPREGCDFLPAGRQTAQGRISIHAPREGCDLNDIRIVSPTDTFQSTHPVRGATRILACPHGQGFISIHAPREGCDLPAFSGCGLFHVFQSTHPVRGATIPVGKIKTVIQHFNPRTP